MAKADLTDTGPLESWLGTAHRPFTAGSGLPEMWGSFPVGRLWPF